MKFGSSITLLKQFVISGVILSSICLANVVAANDFTVTDGSDGGGPNTLRAQVNSANGSPGSRILFSNALPNPTVIPIATPLSILSNMTIDAVTNAPAGLAVGSAWANPLFNISPSVTLTLLGNDQGTGNSTWFGSIVNNGVLVLKQGTNGVVYRGNITGTGALTFSVINGATNFTFAGTSTNTYTGGTTVISGTLTINSANGLPSVGPITVNTGATLAIGNGVGIANAINQTVESLSGGGTFTIADTSSLRLNPSAKSTFSGVISGNNTDVNMVGTGTQTLSGANTTTGLLTINNGTIELAGGAWAAGVTVDQPGTLLVTGATGGVTGNVINAGTITNTDTANAFNIGGTFTQQAGGTINIAIAGPGQNSQFHVTGNTTLNRSTMNVTLPTTTIINDGTVFNNIINNVQAGYTLPTVQSSALFLNFTPSVSGGNVLQLTAKRTPFEDVNNIPALNGIAGELDSLAANPVTNAQFGSVLSVVDSATSQSQFEDILEELAPAGLDGLYAVTMEGLGATDQALLRLDTIRTMGTQGVLARTGYIRTGYAAGDMLEDQGSYGPIVFGNSTKQETRNGLPGYNAVTAGFGFLGDVPILEYFRVGLGLSYANSAVKQSNNTGSNTKIGSTQGLAYGSATYGPLFLDSVLSVGLNNYHGKRNMPLFNVTATSAYTGFQYGAKVKGGFTIPCGQAEISPTAGVQYMHLNVSQYTEKGAGVLNQQVNSTKINSVRAMLGGRLADRSQEEDFFPEIHAFYIVDIRNPNVLITSRFVAGGGSFVSTSALPPKSGVNVGASLTALVTDDFVISGGYDLEAKKSFRSHSASLKFKFLF